VFSDRLRTMCNVLGDGLAAGVINHICITEPRRAALDAMNMTAAIGASASKFGAEKADEFIDVKTQADRNGKNRLCMLLFYFYLSGLQ
jgi:hypothetical protein